MNIDAKELESRLELTVSYKSILYIEIYRKLRELILAGVWNKGEKLTSESELARMMKVGRTSLRSALVVLSEDGYVKTYQGKGTFVTYDIHAPIESYPSKFMMPKRTLARRNKSITWVDQQVLDVGFDGYLDEKLKANGEQIIMLKRGYLLDGIPALFSMMFIKSKKASLCVEDGIEKGIEKYEKMFEEQVSYVNTRLSPVQSLSSCNNFFETVGIEFILLSSATLYNKDDEPIAFVKDYYNTNEIQYRIKMNK